MQAARSIKPQYEIVWEPIPGSSQELALDSRCHHTLYTGARGPGKTDTQLMAFRKNVGKGYGEFWRGVIFDREYKNLDDLIAKSKRWFYAFGDGAKFLSGTNQLKWVWPTGEELLFRVVKRDDDYWNYHGQEFPFIGWNELTKYPTSSLYDSMMSTNRSSFLPEKNTPRRIGHNGGPPLNDDTPYDTPDGKPLPEIPLVVFSTTNPYGAGHNWVKRRFIDPAPYGHVVKKTTNVFDPRLQRNRDVTKTQVAIFGSYRENIYLPAEYVAELDAIKDENKRKAWLLGDWDIVAGGALDDVWQKHIHILPRFNIPKGWHVDRGLDWGSSHPFSVGWFAEANGEEIVLPNGRVFCPPAGTIIQFYEWYGTKEIGTNQGLKYSAKTIAEGIKAREAFLLENGFVSVTPSPGPADNQIRDVRESDVDTIEKKFADEGVIWEHSDKSPGSRINGLQLLRDRLEAAEGGEKPAFYVMENCRATIATVPVLPRDEDKPDDVDTDAEDHPYDVIRYRVLKGNNRIAKFVKVTMPT